MFKPISFRKIWHSLLHSYCIYIVSTWKGLLLRNGPTIRQIMESESGELQRNLPLRFSSEGEYFCLDIWKDN